MNTPEIDRLQAIAHKGTRLQIATELLAGIAVGSDWQNRHPCHAVVARRFSLEQADALIRENEAMP